MHACIVFIKKVALHSRRGEQLFCIWLGHGAASWQSLSPALSCQVPPAPEHGDGGSSTLLPTAPSLAPCGCAGTAQECPQGTLVVSDCGEHQGRYRCGYHCCSRLYHRKGTTLQWWHWGEHVELLRELKLEDQVGGCPGKQKLPRGLWRAPQKIW